MACTMGARGVPVTLLWLSLRNYRRPEQRQFQTLTVARMVPKTVAPVAWRAVSTTVRIAASP